MSLRKMTVFALLWALSLFLVGTLVYAQSYGTNRVTPQIIAGQDFGFRIEGEQKGVPVGLPVVRIDGKWVPVKLGTADGQTHLLR